MFAACKRKDDVIKQEVPGPKKPRLVFTDIQRRTLMAIFKETKRPSKEMQATIADQLGLKVSTVANFFMNARRRSLDKYSDEAGNNNDMDLNDFQDMGDAAAAALDQMEAQNGGGGGGGGGGGVTTTAAAQALTDLDTQQIVSVSAHSMQAPPPPLDSPHVNHHHAQQQQHLSHVPLQAPPTPMQN